MSKQDAGCGCSDKNAGAACRIDSITTMDARGQIVIPKDMREALDWKAGDKIALITRKSDNKPCCLMLVNVNSLSGHVKGFINTLE